MEYGVVLPSGICSAATLTERTVANDDACLDSDDSAFCALTDFRRECPLTVEAANSIDDALDDMHRRSVRALLVTHQDLGDLEQKVVGLITYYDIERKRPHRLARTAFVREQGEIRVGDVMTPWDELPLIHYESLRSLTARDLFEMFKGTGLTHLLVIESGGDESSALARGIISRATLAKRLRRPL